MKYTELPNKTALVIHAMYWSSTEASKESAHFNGTYYGGSPWIGGTSNKEDILNKVRAVRAF
jgi:hypothetical protein